MTSFNPVNEQQRIYVLLQSATTEADLAAINEALNNLRK